LQSAKTEVKTKNQSLKFTKMKTLLKISCVLAIALFVSMSVNAQTLTSQNLAGTITVDVPAFMHFTVTPIGDFVNPHANSTVAAVNSQSNIVEVKSNVKWSVSIIADADVLEGAIDGNNDVIPIVNFSFDNDGAGEYSLSTSATTINGQKDQIINLNWVYTPEDTNYFADEYTVGLTYTLAQRAF
jgi:hypothetical protein